MSQTDIHNRFSILTTELPELAKQLELVAEPASAPQGPAPETGAVLVPRLLVEEWIAFSAQKVWRASATTVAPGDRERGLRLVARIREVSALAGIDLEHVGTGDTDDTDGRLVALSADDDPEASLGWLLATEEPAIRELIERDERRPPIQSKRGRSR